VMLRLRSKPSILRKLGRGSWLASLLACHNGFRNCIAPSCLTTIRICGTVDLLTLGHGRAQPAPLVGVRVAVLMSLCSMSMSTSSWYPRVAAVVLLESLVVDVRLV